MIEHIAVSSCTSYGPSGGEFDGLREVNYIYGANGAGKTTISRLIANPVAFPQSCSLKWKGNHKLETLVYNRDFVRENFSESGKLKGIFTLGKQDVALQNEIDQEKQNSAEFLKLEAQLRHSLEGPDGKGGRQAILQKIEDDFRDECWELKAKHASKLKEALRGYLNDKKLFKKRLLDECEQAPPSTIFALDQLEKRAESLFGDTPTMETALLKLQYQDFVQTESASILGRRILGKEDVDIAAIIGKLGNSDWVQQGVGYLETSAGVCPFCQQNVPSTLAQSLTEYFDESFVADTNELAQLEMDYKLEGDRLQKVIEQLLVAKSRFVALDKLAVEKEIFETRFRSNVKSIATKVKEPSQIISLEPLQKVLDTIAHLVESANKQIESHNLMVANLAKERSSLTADVWAFFAHSEMAKGYKAFCGKREAEQKAIDAINNKITAAAESREKCEAKIRKLEAQVTSVQPTVNEINRLLKGFGFRSFYLEAVKGNLYRLRRADGSDAQDTLSEGERSFITLLYFFHLLKGSVSEAGVNTDRVAIFDDPVSSLDSDVLFIVSSLVRQTIEEVRAKSGRIKQVFVLTHNVYFYKEVIFDKKRGGTNARSDESFWTVRKVNEVSTACKHSSIPVKTAYEMLWSPLRNPNLMDQALQNNMRRVLEYYFCFLGGSSFDEILGLFEGEEKIICRSLMSWMHDGSHSLPDDVFHTLDESAMQRYIDVFRGIFTKKGHASHYNMMMGLPYVIISEAEQVS